MNLTKLTKRLILLLTLGLLFYCIYDWQRKKIDLDREPLAYGWFKYTNEQITFEYPRKLRNCFECRITTGSIYTVLTDGDYVIMFMSGQNSAYLVNPQNIFANPKTENSLLARQTIDSILVANNIAATDDQVANNLKINQIDIAANEEVMEFQLQLLDSLFQTEITAEELARGGENWEYWELNNNDGYEKKLAFGDNSGRCNILEGAQVVFLEFQKIKRTTLYSSNENNLSLAERLRFFRSVAGGW